MINKADGNPSKFMHLIALKSIKNMIDQQKKDENHIDKNIQKLDKTPNRNTKLKLKKIGAGDNSTDIRNFDENYTINTSISQDNHSLSTISRTTQNLTTDTIISKKTMNNILSSDRSERTHNNKDLIISVIDDQQFIPSTDHNIYLHLPKIEEINEAFKKDKPQIRFKSRFNSKSTKNINDRPDLQISFLKKLKERQKQALEALSPLQTPRFSVEIQRSLNLPTHSNNLFKKNDNPGRIPLKGFRKKHIFEDVFQMDYEDSMDPIIVERNSQRKATILEILLIIKDIINDLTNKKLLDKKLSDITQKISKLGCHNMYIYVFKLHGEIMLLCKEYYRAIFLFKALSKICESNFAKKLKVYKKLGRAYQNAGNYKIALFYYIKMLQCAWICNSKRYELHAYDCIGMQHYYMGELKEAIYYHDKMTSGKYEDVDSDLRKIGIRKMMNQVIESPKFTKWQRINTIEEELATSEYPNSEDEFVLPKIDEKISIEESKQMNYSSVDNNTNSNSVSLMKKIHAKRSVEALKSKYTKLHLPAIDIKNGKNEEEDQEWKHKLIKENSINSPKDKIYITHQSTFRALNVDKTIKNNVSNLGVVSPIRNGGINTSYGFGNGNWNGNNNGEKIMDQKIIDNIKSKLEKFKKMLNNTLSTYIDEVQSIIGD